jgi:cholesterol transport system auxiliary component
MSTFRIRAARRGPVMAVLTISLLSGCALMGGGGEPATMFTFGGSPVPAASPSVPMQPITILYVGATVGHQSEGNRILTETGNQEAYIAAARWVAPAPELFDAAVIRRLESISPSVRVIRVGARPRPEYLLAVDVRRFAVVYAGGAGALPEAVIEARAKLVRVADREIVGDWPIDERVRADENRVTAIVAALDQSTQAAVTKIADLTRQAAAGEPAIAMSSGDDQQP